MTVTFRTYFVVVVLAHLIDSVGICNTFISSFDAALIPCLCLH
jgi:hypothetical protein